MLYGRSTTPGRSVPLLWMRIPQLSNTDFTLLVIPMIIYIREWNQFCFGETNLKLIFSFKKFILLQPTTFLPMCKFYELIIKKGKFWLQSVLILLTDTFFCFFLSIYHHKLRMEKIVIRSRTTQAKIWGSIISISGAFIVTFCKGQSIIIADNSPSIQLSQSNGILASVDTNWTFGGLLLTACNILLTIWFVLQVWKWVDHPFDPWSVTFSPKRFLE